MDLVNCSGYIGLQPGAAALFLLDFSGSGSGSGSGFNPYNCSCLYLYHMILFRFVLLTRFWLKKLRVIFFVFNSIFLAF